MSLQQITISLPEKIYRQIQQHSQQMQRSVADEVAAVVTASLPEQAQLSPFMDDELWQAARNTVPADKAARMQELVEKQQLEGLTEAEKAEAELLSHFFNRVMLVRAKAAALLQERGYDVDSLATG